MYVYEYNLYICAELVCILMCVPAWIDVDESPYRDDSCLNWFKRWTSLIQKRRGTNISLSLSLALNEMAPSTNCYDGYSSNRRDSILANAWSFTYIGYCKYDGITNGRDAHTTTITVHIITETKKTWTWQTCCLFPLITVIIMKIYNHDGIWKSTYDDGGDIGSHRLSATWFHLFAVAN